MLSRGSWVISSSLESTNKKLDWSLKTSYKDSHVWPLDDPPVVDVLEGVAGHLLLV